MENYTKNEELSVECLPPFPKELVEGVTEMIVKEGTKFKNIIGYVEKKFEDPSCRRILFRGVGEATAKCISCVEVFKRSYKDGVLYQWNAAAFCRRSDVWEPNKEELSKLLVHVDVPAIFILISRDPFGTNFANDSLQISSEDVTGFPMKNREFGENSVERLEKPRLKRPSEPNKWKRPPKKNGPSGSRLSAGEKQF